jgi:hypothetical protein
MELPVSTQSKTISYSLGPSKIVKSTKDRNRRVITEDKKRWTFSQEELSTYSQRNLIEAIYSKIIQSNYTENINEEHIAFIQQQIRQKIRGYAQQDILKNKLSKESFVNIQDIITKLKECNILCIYCREPVLVLYEYRNDPRQWTVERVDNKRGHVSDNFEIACLSCNIRRRTMRPDKYILTKQLRYIVKSNHDT